MVVVGSRPVEVCGKWRGYCLALNLVVQYITVNFLYKNTIGTGTCILNMMLILIESEAWHE